MADELASPSKDRRRPFASLSDFEVFFCCSGESPEDIRPGAPLQCRVVALTARGALVLQHISSPINCGLRDLAQLRELILCRDPRSDLSCLVGHVLTCRILEIQFQLEMHRGLPSFRVWGACTPEAASAAATIFVGEAAAAKRMANFMSSLSVFDLMATRRPLPIQQEDLASLHRRQLLRSRGNVRHPNFKALSHGKALQLLQSSSVPLGEALFRRCSKRDGFVLMMKTCVQPFRTLCLFIEEREDESAIMEGLAGSSAVSGAAGTVLTLFGTTYSSLDEIIHRYCEPLRVNLEEINNHPKFRRLEVEEALKVLRAEASSQPDTIAWAILPPSPQFGDAPEENASQQHRKDHPLRFNLLVIPPQPAGEQSHDLYFLDGIYVDANEFKLWTHSAHSLYELVKWWKADGYWRRKKMVAEYNEAKARAREDTNRRRQQREALQCKQQLQQSQMEELQRRRQEEGLGVGYRGSAMDLVHRARINQQSQPLGEGGLVRERPRPKFLQEGPVGMAADLQRNAPFDYARGATEEGTPYNDETGYRGGVHQREFGRNSSRGPLSGRDERGFPVATYSNAVYGHRDGGSFGDKRQTSFSQRHDPDRSDERPSSRWDVRNDEWKGRQNQSWFNDREEPDTTFRDEGFNRREGTFEGRGNGRRSRFDRRERTRDF